MREAEKKMQKLAGKWFRGRIGEKTLDIFEVCNNSLLDYIMGVQIEG